MAIDDGQSSAAEARQRPVKLADARSRKVNAWWIVGGVLFSLLLWAYWPTIRNVCAAWTSNADYSHGFFVVPISLWLLWVRRDSAPLSTLRVDWRALSFLALAGVIRMAAARFYIPQFDAWSIPLWIGGVVWLLFGWPLF